jgi:hypothetical protein
LAIYGYDVGVIQPREVGETVTGSKLQVLNEQPATWNHHRILLSY